MNNNIMTINEAMKFLNISDSRILLKLIYNGELKIQEKDGDRYKILKDDLINIFEPALDQ